MNRHALGLVETNDLRYAMEEVSGLSLEWFFHQWCYRPGIPRLKVQVDYDGGTQIGAVRRVNPNGTGLLTLVAGGGRRPYDLAVDPVTAKLYWTEGANGDVGIHRMNLDGTLQEPILTEVGGALIDDPQGLAIDVVGRRLYWTDAGRDEIRRADLDGSNVELLADSASHGLQRPHAPVGGAREGR